MASSSSSGRRNSTCRFPLCAMILENLTVAGVVNAARQHFEAALYDLGNIPRPWLESLIKRRPFDTLARLSRRAGDHA